MSKVLAIDPSGNFKEGYGTSGLCVLENGKPINLAEVRAKDYDEAERYWFEIMSYIDLVNPDVIVMEGYRLYNHKGMTANKQANSELETPQLIGAIRLYCWEHGIPLVIQYAHEVKSRWSEKVLVAKGILGEGNTFDSKQTNDHKRDALKHALHYWRYKHGK